jgi:hypothetical protein
MHTLEKNWWLALADLYEDIAENPRWHTKGEPWFSCIVIEGTPEMGFVGPIVRWKCLCKVWTALGYRDSMEPIGHPRDTDYLKNQEAFCLDMADFIRESVEGE